MPIWRQLRLPSWLKSRKTAIGAAIVALALVVVFALGYAAYQMNWTGFGAHAFTKETTHLKVEGTNESDRAVTGIDVAEDPRRAKTLWDWMQVVGIPVVLAIVGFRFNRAQDRRNREVETRRAGDAALQTYITEMGKLLVEGDLRDSAEGTEVRRLARALTLTVLESLSPPRSSEDLGAHRNRKSLSRDHKFEVLRFLYEAELIKGEGAVIKLEAADLRFVNLGPAEELIGINLVQANLDNAILDGVDLDGAYLTTTSLRNASLRGTRLKSARLLSAKLHGAILAGAVLDGANLTAAEGAEKNQLRQCASYDASTMSPEGTPLATYLAEG